MKRTAVVLVLLAVLLGAPAIAGPAAADPLGDEPPYSCVGPWYKEVQVGPMTVVICDPFMGEPPW